MRSLSAERVRQLLDYDPETGAFKFKERAGDKAFNAKFAGKLAARSSRAKYNRICLPEGRFYAHRLAWLYVTGAMPAKFIDHKNGDPKDNRFSNLREADAPQNGWNSKPHKNNRHGLKGVVKLSPRYRAGRFRANINVRGKAIYLGYFMTEEEAHAAYVAAASKYHGEFARAA